jgi:hypothetical protein
MHVIPLDMLYLFCLGGFLAVASMTLPGLIRWPVALSGFPFSLWWLLPFVYIVFDLAEDGLIFVLLHWPSTISDRAMDVLSLLRAIKTRAVTLSIVQVLLLCLASYIPALRADDP